jgi:hypothetical protein
VHYALAGLERDRPHRETADHRVHVCLESAHVFARRAARLDLIRKVDGERAVRPGFAELAERLRLAHVGLLAHDASDLRTAIELHRQRWLGVVEGNRRIGRDGDQHHLLVGEAIPEPEVSPTDAAHPSAAEGVSDGFVVRRSR